MQLRYVNLLLKSQAENTAAIGAGCSACLKHPA